MAWGIIGQAHAVTVLGRGLAGGRISHAYLITGLPRIGKTSLALALARALNCQEPDPPCDHCRACRLIAKGGHPDVKVLGIQEGKSYINVAQIGELQQDAQLRPLEARYKVYIIPDAETLYRDAAHRILKTLEEPPEHVVLILTAADAESLLETIVSRCQQIRLSPVPEATIRAHLTEHLGLDAERAALLAGLADGRIGWALDVAHDVGLLDARAACLEELRGLLDGDRLARLRAARGLAERWTRGADAQRKGRERDAVRDVLRTWISWWRDLGLVQAGLTGQVRNRDELRALERGAARFPAEAVPRAIRHLEQALDDLDRNVNARMALDLALLGLPAEQKSA